MTDIVAFYRNEAPDHRGRRLREIWAKNDSWLEDVHDYIQVLFPNREPSAFNAHAPLLDDATIAAFLQDESLRQNLASSLDRLLRFFALEFRPDINEVVQQANFPDKAANWLHPYNHNYLRITRILKCLMALGLPERARALYRCLKQIHEQYAVAIGDETLAYWTDAVRKVGPAGTIP